MPARPRYPIAPVDPFTRASDVAIDFTDLGLDPESGLTIKQRCFCDHYLGHLNPRLAYHQAGYTSANPDTARKDANALLKQPDVHSWIGQKMQERATRLSVVADRVLLELVIVAYADVTDYRINPTSGWVEARPGVPQEALRAVKVVKSRSETRTVERDGQTEKITTWTGEIVLHDKLKALELLCRHLGLASAELPPLEVLLNRLPPPVATLIRQMLAMGPRPAERSVVYAEPVDPLVSLPVDGN